MNAQIGYALYTYKCMSRAFSPRFFSFFKKEIAALSVDRSFYQSVFFS